FGVVYKTTQKPPEFELMPNTGVLISTSNSPFGISFIEKDPILEELQLWSDRVNQLYIWDYAVNFNQYFETFPINFVFAQNRPHYINYDVDGVFIQGNENGFSAFADVQSFLLAQQMLYKLNNEELKEIGTSYLLNKYPVTGSILADYYFDLEKNQLKSNRRLSLYGGWKQAYNSYQPIKQLHKLTDELEIL